MDQINAPLVVESFTGIENGFVFNGGKGNAGFALAPIPFPNLGYALTPSPSPKLGEGGRVLMVPWMARLRLSVAPEVKIISLGVSC